MKADVLLVAVTERFLYKNLWGFADDAFEAFSVTSQDEQFFTGVNEILSTDGWFSNLIDDAHNKNIPLSEVLEANADYLVYLNNRDLYLRHYGTAYFEKNIRNDINWFDKIKAIAEKDNIPVEKVLYDVAEHEFEKNHPAIYEEWKFKSDLKKRIISSSDWLSVVRDKAERKYLSLDEMMDIDAEYLWQMHLKQNSSPQ